MKFRNLSPENHENPFALSKCTKIRLFQENNKKQLGKYFLRKKGDGSFFNLKKSFIKIR